MTSGPGEHLHGIGSIKEVAVAEYRDGDRFPHPGNMLQYGGSGTSVRRDSGVEYQKVCSVVLESLGHLCGKPGIIGPSCPEFDKYRYGDGFSNLFDYGCRHLGGLQQLGAASFFADGGNGTAEVEINSEKALFFYSPGCQGHGGRIGSENLTYQPGEFFPAPSKHRRYGGIFMGNGPGAAHSREKEPCSPEMVYKLPECHVPQPCHGSQKKPVGNDFISNDETFVED